MRRLLPLFMALAMLVPMLSSLGALEVTVGNGNEYARFPFDFYYKNSLYECLFYPDELGFASGTLTQLKFYNNSTSETVCTKPIKIWLGTTQATDLSGGFIPSTSLNLVYDGIMDFPTGENTISITLDSPYMYNGGNLVMLCSRVWDTTQTYYNMNFKCQSSAAGRGRYLRSDVTIYDPANPATGTSTAQFPQTTFVYTDQPVLNDLAALTIVGNTTPNQNQETTYTITIKNNGSNTQSNYQVKLMSTPDIELASVDGPSISSQETIQVSVPWTPAQPGSMNICAKVNLANDQNPANDQTPILSIAVQAPGALVVTIGTGTSTNSATSAPTPYGTRYKNFRQQYLYKADELIANGAAPGLITTMAFEVSNLNNCSPMPNFAIRLKHTQLDALTTTFEVGDYTQVFFEDGFMPINGWNIHPFDTPFVWNGVDNILVDIITTLVPGSYTQNASVYYTATTGTNTSLRYQSDTQSADGSATGTASVNRANIRFFLNVSGMGSLSGTVTSDDVAVPDVNIQINDTTYSTVTDALGRYNFPCVSEGTYTVTATKTGYQDAIHPGVVVVGSQTTTVDITMTEMTLPPLDVQVEEVNSSTVNVSWQSPSGGGGDPGSTLDEDFESYQDFALSFGSWVTVDVDNSPTYGIQGVSWTNIYNPQAFIIFNPSQTSPPLTSFTPNSGDKAAVCFNSTQGENNDWLITPQLTPQAGDSFSFWAKSHTIQYGAERFRIGVSQGSTTPADFTIISGGTYVEVPDTWTHYTFDISSYVGQSIRLAINCVSNDAFFLAIDDVSVGAAELALVSHKVVRESTEPLMRSTGTLSVGTHTFSTVQATPRRDRALLGYRVWRLLQGEETSENLWTTLSPEPVTELSFADHDWQNLSSGSYRWAVKAVYTGGVLSPAALSEPLTKVAHIGIIAGIVRNSQDLPVSGATITCGDLAATANDSGAYSMQVEAGVYSVTASHPEYQSVTVNNVQVYANQTTTQNFQMHHVDIDGHIQTPVVTSLNGNYPNPFNPETTISFSLKEHSCVSIEVYNIQGKLVKTLMNEERPAGYHTVIWNGTDNSGRKVASGVYYYRMRSGKYSSTRKMIMLK